jgi:putative hydrolase of the HAD superfamily
VSKGERVTCVVFDLDDTLFLERDYARSGFDAVGDMVASQLGVTDFAERAWAAFERGERGNIFDTALRESGSEVDADVVRALVDAYRAHTPRISLTPDSAKAIDTLREQRTTLAVVTDGPIASQRAKAVALGAGDWSSVSIFTAELGDGFTKPHPRAFEQVELATGRSGASCVYVADNPRKDFAGPRSLGWRTIRVRRPGSLHEAVPSGDVDAETPDVLGALAAFDHHSG